MTPALPQASDILAALGQAVFAWDIASDAIVWGEQVSAIFPGIPAERLATGAEFARLIEPARSQRLPRWRRPQPCMAPTARPTGSSTACA